MTNPTDEQINKRIAEFMGRELVKRGSYWFLVNQVESTELDYVYTISLDALVPVVEKLNRKILADYDECGKDWCFRFYKPSTYGANKSPARALAEAIYYVLEERDRGKR